MGSDIRVSIRPYGEGDIWVLEKTLGDPSQTIFLNGPESEEKIQKRHKKYLALSADPHAGCMLTILVGSDGAPAGNVGYWEYEWKQQKAWEMGWFVLPELQGRGIGTAAARLVIELLVKLQRHRFVLAFPSADNQPSNAICRKLGFTPMEEADFEYPPGSGLTLHTRIWGLTLPISDSALRSG
jgi:RimJ/RimL family protein N-acetyltransferase